MKKNIDTCYMCDLPGETKEHAPPFSLFEKGFRNQLITVPSCHEHNTKQSDDVEFFRFLLAFTSSSNSNIAFNIFKRKILKDLRKKPKKYYQYIGDGVKVKNVRKVAVNIDRDRFDNVCINMINALYFNKFSKKLRSRLFIYSPNLYKFLNSNEIGLDKETMKLIDLTIMLFKKEDLEVEGFNPKIFKYCFFEKDEQTYFGCQFYDFFEIYAFTPKNNHYQNR